MECKEKLLEYKPLGQVIAEKLKRQFSNDNVCLTIYSFAYYMYFIKSPSFVEQFNAAFLSLKARECVDLVKELSGRIDRSIHGFVMHVSNTKEYVRQKLSEISIADFRDRTRTIELVTNTFDCNEDDLQRYTSFMENIGSYDGTVAFPARTRDNTTVVVLYIISF